MMRTWVWLMVGGPWHGHWKELKHLSQPPGPHGRLPYEIQVRKPQKPLTYERAPDFGVPDWTEGSDWYRRVWFDLYRGGEAESEARLEVLLHTNVTRWDDDAGPLVWDAFQEACAKLRREGYAW
jgi:hypothetical protein